MSRGKTRSGATPNPARRVLVVLHARIFHPVAACAVGRYQGCGTKNEHFCPDLPQTARLLDGKLTILFLNGMLPNAVPLLFGELFTTVLYDGVAIDPGSPKMRRSLARHLRRAKTENHESHRHARPRRTRRQPQLAVRPHRGSNLRFGDDRPVPDAVQEAAVGTRCDHRAASKLEAALYLLGESSTPNPGSCR